MPYKSFLFLEDVTSVIENGYPLDSIYSRTSMARTLMSGVP